MLDKVIETIKLYNLINKGDTIVTGVSGGPDSVCLLHVLHSLSERFALKIYAVHINHGLRGSESDADEEFTREICGKLGINLRCLTFNINEVSIQQKISLEEAGREIRYREFRRYATETGASSIAVAHNENDQAETVLMNLFRGTGLSGLTGMEFKRGDIIRPLLGITRSEIERYCEENSLGYRIDSSNLKSDFTRNRVRLELIPEIDRRYGTNLTEALFRMAGLLKKDDAFLEAEAGKAFGSCLENRSEESVSLKLAGLKLLHPALLARVIRMAVGHVKGDLKGIECKHIDDIEELLKKSRTGSSIQLPQGIRAGISYEVLKIYIEKKIEKMDFCRELFVPGHVYIDEAGLLIEASIERECPNIDKYKIMGYNSLEQYFDYDRIKKGINIRNRRAGDVFTPYRSNGTKKLKDYFIDIKIPREKRDTIPLIASGNEVVWIIGNKISDKFKVTENTKRVLKLKAKL